MNGLGKFLMWYLFPEITHSINLVYEKRHCVEKRLQLVPLWQPITIRLRVKVTWVVEKNR